MTEKEIELERMRQAKERFALEGTPTPRIDNRSNTWLAVKEYIKEKTASDYMCVLRNRTTKESETQYARGCIDALEGLLDLEGDE
ncbi:MAG: hypothetical protein JZU65_16190 [Chlorobium sp.]|nr:hypothetical protein [Chlorobium sp.]